MMITWQDAVSLAAVIAAGGYVAYRVYQAVISRQSKGCTGCVKCESADDKQLVTLDAPSLSPKRDRDPARSEC